MANHRKFDTEDDGKVKDGIAVYGFGIRVGLAVLQWCDLGCWILPEGPNQKSRKVIDADSALRYAREMHRLISGVA